MALDNPLKYANPNVAPGILSKEGADFVRAAATPPAAQPPGLGQRMAQGARTMGTKIAGVAQDAGTKFMGAAQNVGPKIAGAVEAARPQVAAAASRVASNPLVRAVTSPAFIGLSAATHSRELAPGTLPQWAIDAGNRPYDPNFKAPDLSDPANLAPAAMQKPQQPNPLSFTPGQATQAVRNRPGASGEAMPIQAPAYRDIGSGVFARGVGRRGQPNDFTNIGADGKPTALSMVDSRTPDQIANGERIKAETAAILRNPDGSKWSANDNATMAANIRDGVNPLRGTSQAPRMSAGQAYMQQAMSAPRTLANLTPRQMARIQEQAANIDNQAAQVQNAQRAQEVTMRGQDMDLESRMAPLRMQREIAQQQRNLIAQASQAAGGNPLKTASVLANAGFLDQANAFNDIAKSQQTVGHNANSNLMARLNTLNSKEDPDAGNRAYQFAMRASNGKLADMGEEDQNALLSEAIMRHQLTGAANKKLDTSLGKMIGFDNAPKLDDLPSDEELKGASWKTMNVGDGLLFSDAEMGDYELALADGRKMYMDPREVSSGHMNYLASKGVKMNPLKGAQ